MSIFGRWKGRSLNELSGKKIKRNILPYSVLVAAVFAMTFFGVCVPDYGPKGPRGPAAFIRHEVISFHEFRREYENQRTQAQSQYGDEYDPQKAAIAQQTLSRLISSRVAYMIAENIGLGASKASVHESMRDSQYFHNDEGKFDRELFQRILDYQGLTEATLFHQWARDLTLAKIQSLVASAVFNPATKKIWQEAATTSKIQLAFLTINPQTVNVEIRDEDLKKFLANKDNFQLIKDEYQNNIHLYQSDAQRRAKHIVIAYQGARNALGVSRSKDEAKKLARNLLDQVSNKPDLFSDLVLKYSDDRTSQNKDGDLGFFSKNQISKEISDVAFSLKKNEWAPLIETPFGFHILQVTDYKEARSVAFDDIQQELAKNHLKIQNQRQSSVNLALEVIRALEVVSQPSDANQDFVTKTTDGDNNQKATEAPSFTELQKNHKLSWQKSTEISFNDTSVPEIGNMPALMIDLLTEISRHDDKQKVLGKTLPRYYEEGGMLYIVKIVKVTPATVNLDPKADKTPDQQDPLSALSQYEVLQASFFFQNLINYYIDLWNREKLIKRNPDYLKLDTPAS
ncbi:MAG: peptidylprolyl isomerase [Proteobacteria bacterium]|nr:peptidylprolyl isomerase [Pseudomonadota bacterium]